MPLGLPLRRHWRKAAGNSSSFPYLSRMPLSTWNVRIKLDPILMPHRQLPAWDSRGTVFGMPDPRSRFSLDQEDSVCASILPSRVHEDRKRSIRRCRWDGPCPRQTTRRQKLLECQSARAVESAVRDCSRVDAATARPRMNAPLNRSGRRPRLSSAIRRMRVRNRPVGVSRQHRTGEAPNGCRSHKQSSLT